MLASFGAGWALTTALAGMLFAPVGALRCEPGRGGAGLELAAA
ncbi:hypothetical protein C731_1034 [Mycolicibacterium hassiacum DSM 44199]|uniref:Uncharacterized protein n=1 Tax=Mycolicibacterium hassiacum (strain DSM 44199 / CIP 105218 / JCM 12690 / 3849) TaxID=1122247 RepID=K5BKH2_MYCHD|nr:hypothetical protein C731_1034 [Mycolicibacterium hassiacum DSM 44199]MDA4088165.1 hypothetical protein [Mycolicibacterium hassiacum DSM 44199]